MLSRLGMSFFQKAFPKKNPALFIRTSISLVFFIISSNRVTSFSFSEVRKDNFNIYVVFYFQFFNIK